MFGSERLTGALLDRLTHHVHILEMNGDSYRLAGDSLARWTEVDGRANARLARHPSGPAGGERNSVGPGGGWAMPSSARRANPRVA